MIIKKQSILFMRIGWKILGKFTDDKEPAGTAGKPIYAMLEKENLVNIVIIVVRYFGGVLLGTGPLTRAYLGVATATVQKCEKEEYVKRIKKEIVVEYDKEKDTLYDIQKNNGKILNIEYAEKIKITVNMPEK